MTTPIRTIRVFETSLFLYVPSEMQAERAAQNLEPLPVVEITQEKCSPEEWATLTAIFSLAGDPKSPPLLSVLHDRDEAAGIEAQKAAAAALLARLEPDPAARAALVEAAAETPSDEANTAPDAKR